MPALSAFGRGVLEVQSHPWVYGEFETSVGDMTFCQKETKKGVGTKEKRERLVYISEFRGSL